MLLRSHCLPGPKMWGRSWRPRKRKTTSLAKRCRQGPGAPADDIEPPLINLLTKLPLPFHLAFLSFPPATRNTSTYDSPTQNISTMARTARLSGLQRDVLSLYRRCLRAARLKPAANRPNFEAFARREFARYLPLDKKDFGAIEFLLRKGQKQLEVYEAPGIRNIAG